MKRKKTLTKEQLAVLVGTAEAFLRAGGVLLWSDFEGLGEAHKAAFMAANEIIQVERARLIALAINGQLEPKATTETQIEANLSDVANGVLDKWKSGGQ